MDDKTFDDSFGKLPTNVTADTLTFNAKSRIFTYQGNVQVTQGDMRLTAKTLEGTYSEQNQLQKLVAKGDVQITKQDIQATGQVASYDAISAVVTLTDNPQLQQEESVLRADRIKIFLNENRSQAEGDVRVTFVNNKESGQRPSSSNESTSQAASPTPQASPTPEAKKTTGSSSASSTSTAKAAKKPTPKPTKKPTPKSTTTKKK
jgi:lipopolysaccharide export system protein LptA